MELVEESPYRFRIDRHDPMRVPGVIFASRSLLPDARADKSLDQVANVAHLPGIVGASMAMPDIHWGYGFPIGGVAATDVEAGGVVSPGGVGFDIGCGVRLLRSSMPWEDASPRIERLVDAVAAAVPRGVGGRGLASLTRADVDEVLVAGSRWVVGRGMGTERDLECCEDGGALQGADPLAVSDK